MEHTALDKLMGRIGERVLLQEDLLRTAWAVRRNDAASEELFDRLADVCLEQLFLDLEFRHVVDELNDDEYVLEVARLITQCRTVGIDPPVKVNELDLTADEHARRDADSAE
ncbi:MAG TPA: hypothetical protein VI916_10920 [Acidimicrobiia bacterium]|nr:hypothetical protein [Acidimicrobiia bacterium]